jgi:RNA polymerase sigma-70 factor (ECF subfamily)
MEMVDTIATILTRKVEISDQNPDFKVVDSVLNDNVDDFIVLVNKYQTRVFSMIAKRVPVSDIEDVAQEAFIRAFKNLKTFSQKKPFENWLSIITLRTCCDYWRKNARRKEFTAPANDSAHLKWLELVATDMASEHHRNKVSNKDMRELLDWTLEKLSIEDRTLIEMIYFEGHSMKEAAEVLSWGGSKTKVRAMRARSKMRKILTKLIEAQS